MLKCEHCGTTQEVPKHCGKDMHIEGDKLICWMGEHCGSQELPTHCGAPMKIV